MEHRIRLPKQVSVHNLRSSLTRQAQTNHDDRRMSMMDSWRLEVALVMRSARCFLQRRPWISTSRREGAADVPAGPDDAPFSSQSKVAARIILTQFHTKQETPKPGRPESGGGIAASVCACTCVGPTALVVYTGSFVHTS
jgi:hypothetical protein